MRIALLGYGKMGRQIERLAPEVGATVAGVVDSADVPLPNEFDVAIDFSQPTAVLGNVRRLAAVGKPVVLGTTGWLDEREEIEHLVASSGIGLVYASNFSVGVNLFFKLVEQAARLLRDQPQYEAWAYEIHHSAKLDAPSGTLLQLVDTMRAAGYSSQIDISSNRAGSVPGTHEIGFDSSVDTITLRHTARNREGFARGALLAAKLIQGKAGFFAFSDLLGSSA